MIPRQQAHKAFVKAFKWSTGRSFLLVDMMTEHREMLEDAAIHAIKYLSMGQSRNASEVERLSASAKAVGLSAIKLAAGESDRKLVIVRRLIKNREIKLTTAIMGRRLQ